LLRVIRDRLENGQIDDSGALTPPRGIRNVTVLERETESDATGEQIVPEGTVVPTGHHPAAQLRIAVPPVAQPAQPAADQVRWADRVVDRLPGAGGLRGE